MIGGVRGSILATLHILACLVVVSALAGCGGGSGGAAPGGTQSFDTTRGALEFRITFPAVNRGVKPTPAKTRGGSPFDGSVPLGSHSVRITVVDNAGNMLAPARIVSDTQRPSGVSGPITVGFPLLPQGPAKVEVIAFPTLDATGTELARGAATASIVANTTASTTVLLQLAFNRFIVTPKSQVLDTLGTGPPPTGIVNAQAVDAQGNPLLYPLQYTSDQPQIANVTSVTPDFMHATVTAFVRIQTPTPVTITITELNSGATDTATVIVGP